MLQGTDILDNHAYLLWLTAVSHTDGTATDLGRQEAMITKIRLTSDDKVALLIILADFRSKHDALVAAYNESVSSGSPRSFASLLSDLLSLVTYTQTRINQSLTPDGAASIRIHVVNEKTRMRVPATWGAQ
jgi:hypothetical protein